jgi:PTH1 family peptidyl-tRNA hydrolase
LSGLFFAGLNALQPTFANLSAMPTPLQIIAGLGNPGPEYELTRHNAGFWFVDNLALQLKAQFSRERAFNAEVAKSRIDGRDVWLIKPQTYMNRSGQSIAALMRFYKLNPEQLLVVHDELDLLPGTIKLKKGGGTGGHNGLKDIQAQLSTADWWRMRLAIGHPRSFGMAQEVVDFVLHKPGKEHLTQIEAAMARGLDVMPHILAGDMERAMKQLHGKEPVTVSAR